MTTRRDHPARPRLGDQFAEVLDAAQSGAGWALERLWRELSPVVAGYLRVQGAAEPDDIASDTFLAAFSKLRSFRGGEAQFRSWIFTIAHHRLIDERRRIGRRPQPAGERAHVAADRIAGGDVEHEALKALSRDRVRRLCDALSPDQRDVVLLRMVAGMSLEETAATVGKSIGAVKALQHRAIDALRRQLATSGAEKSPEGVSPVIDPGVHGDEMPSLSPHDEAAVEALLAGRTNDAATGELGSLTALVEDVWAAVDGPAPASKPELAALMVAGLSDVEPTPQVAGRPIRRKTRMTVSGLLAALATKAASLGMAAKAALGMGLAAATLTTAAAAGVLPDPAQHAFASAVNTVSPFDLPDPGGAPAGVAAEDVAATTTTIPSTSTKLPGDGDEGTDDTDAVVATNHGACVSEVARDAAHGQGQSHGQAVSEVAKSDCGKDSDETTSTTEPTTSTTEVAQAGADSGQGSGNAHGRGQRNSGSGNAGATKGKSQNP